MFLERRKAETLLRSMLPAQVLTSILEGTHMHLSNYATVGFCQVELASAKRMNYLTSRVSGSGSNHGESSSNGMPPVAATPASSIPSPSELMQRLHDTFKRIDNIVNIYQIRGVHKIETVSKTYLLCAGLLDDVDDHASAMIDVSLEIMNMVQNRSGQTTRIPTSLRVGISTGPVVGGMIGAQRRYFRIFGDVVNTSARMCMYAQLGEIQMSSSTFTSLTSFQRASYKFELPRIIEIKGKGTMTCYVVDSRDDWIPKFNKPMMSRGENHAEKSVNLLNKSFVYHKVIEQTQLTRDLQFQSPDDDELEHKFQAYYSAQFSRSTRTVNVALSVFMIGVLVYHLLTASPGPSALPVSVPILLLLLIAWLIMQVVLSFQVAWYTRLFQHNLTVSVAVLGGWVVATLAAWGLCGSVSPAFSMLTVVLYACMFLHVQFRYVVPIVSALVIGFFVTLWCIDAAWYDIILVTANLLLAMVVGFVVSGSVEKQFRLNYLLQYALQKEQASMDEFLNNLLPQFVVDVLKKNTKRTPNGHERLSLQGTMTQRGPMGTMTQRGPLGTSSSMAPHGSAAPNAVGPQADGANHQLRISIAAPINSTFYSPNGDGVGGGGGTGVASRFAMHFPHTTVFESDIVGYTKMVADWSAEQTLSMLNNIFVRFDEVAARCQVEKIETIGDAFMCVVFEGDPDPILDFALMIVSVLNELNTSSEHPVYIRMGICTGSCFGGVIGTKIPRFYLLGEAHDVAIAIEQNGRAMQAIVSSSTYEATKSRYEFELIADLHVNTGTATHQGGEDNFYQLIRHV